MSPTKVVADCYLVIENVYLPNTRTGGFTATTTSFSMYNETERKIEKMRINRASKFHQNIM